MALKKHEIKCQLFNSLFAKWIMIDLLTFSHHDEISAKYPSNEHG